MSEEKGIPPWCGLADNYLDFLKVHRLNMFSELKEMKKKHFLMDRNIIFAHTGYEYIRDAIESETPFVVISGIMAHKNLHFGHKALLDQLVWYQQFKNAEIFLAISDLEGWLFSGRTIKESIKIAINEYILDYLSLREMNGIKNNLKNLHIYSQWARKEVVYFAFSLSNEVDIDTLRFKYNFSRSSKMGQLFFPFIIVGDILHTQLKKFGGPRPILVPAGTNQIKYINFAKTLIQKKNKKCKHDFCLLALTFHKILPGIDGKDMLSEDSAKRENRTNNAIFLNDSPDDVRDKILRAVSGGRESISEQKKMGGLPLKCMPFELLLFNYKNNKFIENIYHECTSGARICAECKKEIAEYFTKWITDFKNVKEKLKESDKILRFILEQDILRETESITEITEHGGMVDG